jgi:ATP-dependent DNA helicase 2 subunit 1
LKLNPSKGYKLDKDAVLFAIHVSESMLAPPPESHSKKADRDSPTLAALKTAYQLMQQRIISNPNDMMGVLLFGTEESKIIDGDDEDKTMAYPHCYVLVDLDVPAAEDVKRLRDLVNDEAEYSGLLVPSKDPVAMANVLFCANQIFTTKAANFNSRRLFIVTDDDSPHASDKASSSAAAVRAKDLYDLGVIIELFPIAQPGKDFDRTKFYDVRLSYALQVNLLTLLEDIVYRGLLSDPEAPAPIVQAAKTSSTGDGITLLQSLLSSVNSKAAQRRAQFSLPLEIGPGL